MPRLLGPVLAITAAAVGGACSDPTLDIRLGYADADLEARLVRSTLSVVVVDGPSGAPATCDDVAYGLIPPEVLEGGRRAFASAGESPRITGVPRLGPKLFLFEGQSAAGRRLAGGCTYLEDVEHDQPVTIVAQVAPRVRIFRRSEEAPLEVYAERPWQPTGPVVGALVRAELRGGAGIVEVAPADRPTTNADGVATLPALTLAGAGPQQLVVRVPWAEPSLLSGVKLWPEIADPIVVDTTTRNGTYDPSWVVKGSPPWTAYGLDVPGNDLEPRLIEVTYDPGSRKLVRDAIVRTPGVRAMGGWTEALVAVVETTGWVSITEGGLVPLGGTAAGAGAATAIVRIDPCIAADPVGLLVRRPVTANDEQTEAWTAYAAPGQVLPQGPLFELARALNENVGGTGLGTIAGQVCLQGTKRIVAIRRGDLFMSAFTTADAGRRPLPIVSAFTAIGRGAGAGLAGVEVGIGGPRAVSFTLTRIGSTEVFIDNDAVTAELASIPTTLLIETLYPDGNASMADDGRDLIAALEGTSGSRLQVSLQDRKDGMLQTSWTISGLSSTIAGNAPRLRVDDVDGDGKVDELVVLTSRTLRVFRVRP